jgi:hypothetical protein
MRTPVGALQKTVCRGGAAKAGTAVTATIAAMTATTINTVSKRLMGEAGLRSPAYYCPNAKTILGLERYAQEPYGVFLRKVASIH